MKYVYAFSEGNRDLKDLLGGKGANLAEMTNMGLPVPPGFVITTEACRTYLRTGVEPPGLGPEIDEHLAALEAATGRRLGQADDPLLVAVRSGGASSMPGMMETVLDVGLTDSSVLGLARVTGDDRFAWDSYRRLIHMFGTTVLGIDGAHFDTVFDERKRLRGTASDVDLDAGDLRAVVAAFQGVVREHSGHDFPQDPHEQLTMAVRAVFASWNSPRAATYRHREHIPADLGTAVSVVAMVFGNLGAGSGSGVAFTRDPATGEKGVYGDYLENAQGEDVVAGIRNTLPLTELEHRDPVSYHRLREIMATLEHHYRDLCDVEFTIERGTLWMLQTRVGKRTAAAAFVIACQLVDDGLIDDDEALRRVTGDQLAQLMFPRFDAAAGAKVLTVGMNASPGAATGVVVFDSPTAVARAAAGERVILVRNETTPDDLDGMIAARGVLTSRGGRTSHAAVVARGMGTTCVCGAEELDIDVAGRRLTGPGGVVVAEGEVISIDGGTGEVFLGEVPVVRSPVVDYFEDGSTATGGLVHAVHRLMTHADTRRRLEVRANADTAEDADRARRFGARGIGLARTEHMFLGDRREHVERLVLADTDAGRDAALAALLPLQHDDFVELFTAMDGLPVTIRLLDPPLHEFLPDLTTLAVRVALAQERGTTDERDVALLAAVRRLHEENPMLGLRGVRLGIAVPGLFGMQVRAIARAAVTATRAGIDVRPEIMIPLVGAAAELRDVVAEITAVLEEEAAATGVRLDAPLGTMIELPRAALTAGAIAETAAFFSFGTNDLTQTTWGFSRDDVEGSFFSRYLDHGIFAASPFETLDVEGVGRLIALAAAEGRAVRPDLQLGVCGEHGGDPDSVHFFHRAGLDYVSCSPFRVPVARLEAGRAALSGAVGP
ncbi:MULTISPECIES: pyruvate, phosphate dikinase [unclassified Pseudonocardia]|uniref:pyruvate, phosphate dikinase n=1 Tax=unclassified Pseudonocardia TaxID=2619320 RepID=UPI0009684F85|nr:MULTISPECIES: pyruvate, phosphate dikinase [unclassified Pseudonocardia]MBN9101212.1 pyruvate, phosphate dikinase [Pseudonocardia sp.]OJY38469.1 MAG: pyruvate, phosphate dikinase [Pseudonocardia sp. 73-21]